MNILTNINLNKNQVQNAVLHPLAQAPASPQLGQLYFNTTDLTIYQYNGSDAGWKKVGVVYNQSSSTGAVITGLDTNGNVTTNNVISLTLTGYSPVDDGYVTPDMSLQDAIAALDEAVKSAVAGGQINQDAWSFINAGGTTISAGAEKDAFNISGSGGATVSGNASTKTITVNVPIDTSMSSTSTNPIQNKIVTTAIDAKYTKPSGGIPESDLASALQNKIDNAVQKDGSTAMTGNLKMGSHKITGISDGTDDTDAVSLGQMNIALGAKVDVDDLPTTPVVTDFDLSYSGDTVTINKDYLNIKTGSTSNDDEVIALANDETAGLMSPSSVIAISDLQDRVQALEGTTVRLLYSTKAQPNATEIEAFVRAQGYTDSTKWSGIAVVVNGTYHIWHYYSGGTGWRDDGVDTVSQWTNATPGIIKGSTADGKIYAEDDGIGSVNGWDALKVRVTNVENNKADQSDVDDIPVVETAVGTIATTARTASVGYSGSLIGYFVKDGSGNTVITDVAIGSSAVTFTVTQNPSTALTATVIYIN